MAMCSLLVLVTAMVVRPPAQVVVSSPSHCRSAAPISSAVVLTREEEAKAAWLAKQDVPLWGPAARSSSAAPRRTPGRVRDSAASYLYSTMLQPKAKVRYDAAVVCETRDWKAIEEAAIARQASHSSEPTQATLLDTVRSARWSWGGVWNGWRGVHVVVSVDWEGSRFNAEDLAAFSQFRDDFPNVRLTHFLNAAYYTKLAPDDVRAAVNATDQIRTALRDGDEIGLHVHADDHLLRAAGVAPKKFPSWNNLPDETGHSVPLSAFSEEEVRRIVAWSCRTLERQGFKRPTAFRAGGWHAGGNVMNALAAEGFAVDSSEVPTDWLPRHFGEVPDLWPDATRVSQPYHLQDGLVEVPDNGCLADYVTADQMVDTFKAVVQSGQREAKPVVLSLGFHQETAAKFLPRLRNALLEIELRAAMQRIPLSYDRLQDVAPV